MPKQSRYQPGPDVDPDTEKIRDRKGNLVDEAYIERAVADVHAHLAAGRPSLTAPGQHSPQVSFRVPATLRAAALGRAQAEGKTVSALAREAFEQYLKQVKRPAPETHLVKPKRPAVPPRPR